MFARMYVKSWQLHRRLCSFISNQCHARRASSISRSIPLSTNGMSRDAKVSRESPSSSTRLGKSQYRLVEDVEDLDRYCPGGYHPLQIGDELDDGRYRLVDKLGYGGYSTIWLARDQRRAGYVAVKIITADTSSCSREASLIQYLGNLPPRPGREIIPSLINEFWVSGHNGKHKCIVTPSAQMSLFDAKEASTFGIFRPNVAQSIVAQLIRGVSFLHGENVIHGDLHLGNILTQFPKTIDSFSTSDLYARFGEPESEAIVRIDGKPLLNGVPTRVFIPGWFGVRSDEIVLGEEKIILGDFGESFNPHKAPRFSSKTLPLLQPPEARFSDEPLSFASDIWTLACTVWEIFGQRPLFEAFFPTADRVTMEQVQALGILAPEWWKKWSRRSEWFNEDGELDPKVEKSRGVRKTLDQRLDYCIQVPRAEAGMETMTKEERQAFEAMLRRMLTFQPKDRATAKQILQSEWMKGWGLLALKQSWSIAESARKRK